MTFQTQFHDCQVTGKKSAGGTDCSEGASSYSAGQTFVLQIPAIPEAISPSVPTSLATITSCPGVSNSSLVLILPERAFTALAPGITHPVFPLSCTPYHFSEMKRQRAGDEEKQRTLPAASTAAAVSMAHFPLLSVTPADPPYELVSRNVSLLGVWRRETVLMPAPHTEDFISFLIFCLGAPAASNFPQL